MRINFERYFTTMTLNLKTLIKTEEKKMYSIGVATVVVLLINNYFIMYMMNEWVLGILATRYESE